jgi:hypothetical protein
MILRAPALLVWILSTKHLAKKHVMDIGLAYTFSKFIVYIFICLIMFRFLLTVDIIIYYHYLFLFRSARSIGLQQCLAIRGSCFSFLDPLDIW